MITALAIAVTYVVFNFILVPVACLPLLGFKRFRGDA